MFGQNPLRKQDLSSPGRLWIQEVFATIQGEGPFVGHPAVFVRLGGCNLKCFWCDTDFESSTWYPSVSELVDDIDEKYREMGQEFDYPLVVLTGGEPLRQDIRWLLDELREHGYTVQIETNGITWIDGLEKYIQDGMLHLVCSPKTGKVHPKIREWCSHWKYIVDQLSGCPKDGLPMASTQVEGKSIRIARPWESDREAHFMPIAGTTVWVQPLDSDDEVFRKKGGSLAFTFTDDNTRYAVQTAMKFGYRLCLQTHKIVGLP